MKIIRNGFRSVFYTILLCCIASLAHADVKPTESATAQTNQTQQTTTAPATTTTTDANQIPPETTNPNDLAATNADPYERLNRVVFTFNDQVDRFIMKPVARVYNAIMPTPLNQGIHNVFLNIGNLPTIANDLLQFNFYQTANDTWRLLINTTVGVGGLFDIAGRIGLKPYINDFGLTMAAWGWKRSNYLVLPFFGPSTPRDGIGIPVDYFAFSIYPYIQPESTRYQLYGLGVVDRRAQLLKYQEVLEEAAVDRYVFLRNAYMQRREHLIDENQHLGFRDRESNQPIVANGNTTTEANIGTAKGSNVQQYE